MEHTKCYWVLKGKNSCFHIGHLFELSIELSSGCLPGQKGASISGREQNRYKDTEAKGFRELSLKGCIYLAQGLELCLVWEGF